jgi:hypothetical protein
MKYLDGSDMKIEDVVEFGRSDRGRIVASIDTGDYSKEFQEQEWGYLKIGVLVKTDAGAIVHLTDFADVVNLHVRRI